MENRISIRIGEIEFKAEGSEDLIERERGVFFDTILPTAIDAIVRTRGTENSVQYIDAVEQPALTIVEEEKQNEQEVSDVQEAKKFTILNMDLSRTSLASFISSFGNLSEQDFTLVAAYYDEKKNNAQFFTSETVKQYYIEARRPEYSNVSELVKQLTKKGLIMDAPNPTKKIPKEYILTDNGIRYVEDYQPKDEKVDRKNKNVKSKRLRKKTVSIYTSLSPDDLNLQNYPEIKEQSSFKKQMLLIMYIIINENKGDSFSVVDIQYLMTDMLGLPASIDQINGVFKKNKSWFKPEQDSDNKKAYRRKLLQGGKDFAQSIISQPNQ